MKTKVIVLIVLTLVLIYTFTQIDPEKLKPITVFKPNTIVGNLNLSKTPRDVGIANLNDRLNKPFYINLESKSRGVTAKEIGIEIDRDKLQKLTVTCRTKIFLIFCKNTSNEIITPNTVLNIDETKLNAFINELNGEVEYLSKSPIISFTNYSFRALSPLAQVKIDEESFKDINNLALALTTDNFIFDLKILSEDDKEAQKLATQTLITKISVPLTIKYGRNVISIPSETINGFIKTGERDGFMYGLIDKEKVSKYLETLPNIYTTESIKMVKPEAIDAISRALLYKASNTQINNAVILPLEGVPTTQGELHTEYLEVNKSQQRLYHFKEGKIVKTYIVSTGLTWETPPGKFEVLGKQKMAISYVGNWFMPNYLPIGTINGYFFGFHEIPYHLDGAGNIYARDENTMGSPATGGCIQLTKADAEEVFEIIDVGTPVYIYE